MKQGTNFIKNFTVFDRKISNHIYFPGCGSRQQIPWFYLKSSFKNPPKMMGTHSVGLIRRIFLKAIGQ